MHMKVGKRLIIPAAALCAAVGLTCCLVSASDGGSQFRDVGERDWFFEPVQYVCSRGIMNGSGDSLFLPNSEATRGMIVTMLYRLDGSPDFGGQSPFSDTGPGEYYYAPAVWAARNGIVTGSGGGRFEPNGNITREQLAAILYRYAAYRGMDTSPRCELSSFADADDISSYARDAMSWAVASGLIGGVSENVLQPGGPALRAQVAAVMMRFVEGTSTDADPPEQDENAEYIIHRRDDTSDETDVSRPERPAPSPDEDDSREDEQEPPQADGFALTVIGAGAEAGDDEVTVHIAVRNNPGILGMRLIISYDDSSLTMTGASNGDALDGVLTLTPGKTLKSGCAFLWDGLELSDDDIRDGSVLALRFSVSSSAEAGKYPIAISFRSGDIIGNDLEAINPEIENGYISVN